MVLSGLINDPPNPPSYSVAADGERFLVRLENEDVNTSEGEIPMRSDFRVIEGWFEELNRLAPSN